MEPWGLERPEHQAAVSGLPLPHDRRNGARVERREHGWVPAHRLASVVPQIGARRRTAGARRVSGCPLPRLVQPQWEPRRRTAGSTLQAGVYTGRRTARSRNGARRRTAGERSTRTASGTTRHQPRLSPPSTGGNTCRVGPVNDRDLRAAMEPALNSRNISVSARHQPVLRGAAMGPIPGTRGTAKS